jgi:putative oxidoreductase
MHTRSSVSNAPGQGALGLLILRVALGVVFLTHGLFKPLVLTFAGTAAFFESFGFPGWTVYPVFLAEVIGGLALIAGQGTRWAAAALIPVVLGAFRVHGPNGWYFGAPNGGWEYLAVLIAGLVAVILLGPGAFALRIRRPGSSAAAG